MRKGRKTVTKWNYVPEHWQTIEQDIEESGEKNNELLREQKIPRGRSKSSDIINVYKEWSDEEIFLLINGWRKINQICNIKHPKYHWKKNSLKT